MKNGSAKLLLVFIVISMLISSSYCCVMTVRGQFAIPPRAPINVWIDISPNPAYLGEDIKFTIIVVSEELFGKQVKFTGGMGAMIPEGTAIAIKPGFEGKIPGGCTYTSSTDKLLKEVAGGYSAEWVIQVSTSIEGYCGKLWQEKFYIYNYSRPPDKPYLLLRKSTEKGEGLIEKVVTVEVENIGSGNAKNVEIKDSLPPSFDLISGTLTQKYESIRPREHKTFKYTIKPLEEGTFILDSATATYEDRKGNSYSSTSNPFVMGTGLLAITIKYPGKEGWEEIKIPLEEFKPIPTPTQPAPTAPVIPSPTPSPKHTPSPTSSPIEQTPTPLPSPPPPDDGNKSWIFLVIAVVAGIVVLFSFKPIMIAYYTMKMNKWEREGYDVSKLKEVLKR